MMFVLIFSALAVSMATISGTSVQLADNQRKADSARASAESGLDVLRFWLNRISIPASTPQAHRFYSIATSLQNDLTENNITNINMYPGSSTIYIPSVTLNLDKMQNFSALITHIGAETLRLDVTGAHGLFTKTIRVNYDMEPYAYPIFDFGLATKGPVHFLGNPTVRGANSNREADIYIESQNNNLALLITGNTNFDGDISIANINANADFQGNVLIGGDHGQEAIDNHVFIGVGPTEFPVPDTAHFQQYATGNVIDSSDDTSDNMTLTNVTIQAGTNPTFEGNIIIKGILFIEPPNRITFNGNVDARGMIVADGNVDEPGTNKITFLGNFATSPFPNDSQFDVIRSETGSSILAPAFAASFAGNFSALGGVMAVNTTHFSGNVSAVVKGTIINYSEDNPTIVAGNATLNFDRSDNIRIPAGFDTLRILTYEPSSYEEIASYY